MGTDTTITIKSEVKRPVADVWQSWTSAEHIKHWNNASDEWHTPDVEIDVQEGGKFKYRMEAKDGSSGFDFTGTFTKVTENELLEYTLSDNRKVAIKFAKKDDNTTHLHQVFESAKDNEVEMQRAGWQAILTNFKDYTEKNFN